ncbi:TPA: hypothetical protein ACH3X2_001571 [Trebouxia sp. C0005]
MDLDVAKLEQELQGIYQERQAVTERIRTYAPGRGRGRGMGPPGAPFRAGALPGRGVPGRELYGQPEFEGPHPRSHLPGPPSASRASDWPPRNNGYPVRSLRDVPQSSVMNRLGPRVSQDRQKPATEPEFASAEAPVSSEPAGSRKRLLSAVVVDGETRLPSQSDESMTAKRPKPDDVEDNPAAKKRNRRMFGFLNQTLQKCKDESSDFRKSRVAQQRDEALKRAEERRREELVKFKADFKREMAAKRQAEMNLKRELNMQAEVKRAEIGLVQRVLHRSKIAKFIQTNAGPPLCWLPGKHNAATQSLLEKEQEKLEAFKLEEAAKMETKRQSVAENVAAMARAAEAAAARRLAAAEAAAQTKATATLAAEPSGRDNADKMASAAVAAEEEDEAGVAEGVEDDEVEDGAYVVLDEEEEDAENQDAANQQAQLDRSVNGTAAHLSNADDDRYIAEAYSAGEEQFDRARNASQEPAAEGVTEATELNKESHQEDPDHPNQEASHQVDPVVNVADADNSMQNAGTALPESVLPAAKAKEDKSADMDTSQAVKATSLGDLAEPMETDAK